MFKNRVVVNILIAYFILLTIVLVVQIPKKDITANEPIASELKYEEKLKNAVVLYVGSPLAVINESQIIIDENDPCVTPEIVDGKTYIPVSILKTAFNAAVNWNKQDKETTIRHNNTAIIFKNESNSIKVVDNNSEKEEEIETAPLILHNRAYIPLRTAVDIFEKEVFYNNNLIIISDIKDIFDPTTEIDKLNLLTSQVNSLPVVGSEDKLKSLVAEPNGKFLINSISKENNLVNSNNSKESKGPQISADFSGTNNQVDGVAEADIIKTDDEYIYYVKDKDIEIVKVTNPDNDNMEIAAKINIGDNFIPMSIYVKDKNLIVLGDYYEDMQNTNEDIKKSEENNAEKDDNLNIHSKLSRIYIYSLENINSPTLLRTIDTDGYYFDSRMIKNTLYIISTINVFELYDEKNFYPVSYFDSALGNERIVEEFENISYFPDMTNRDYTTIISLDISDSGSSPDIKTYLGSGDDIYVSNNNLYFACRKYNTAVYGTSNIETNIYKFNLSDGAAVYSKRANIDGAVLNQFSMDERNNSFRVASTEMKDGKQSNNIFIFNSDFEKCGEIRDAAVGEKIYSVRFLGDRAYMVTFENTDPLFVIDLKNPNNPSILGSLKIPGYSNYLHPYDENHLIGLGNDVISYNNAIYSEGVKISMFDVSDVSNPIEKFSEIVGSRGTGSPALKNHKAFLFNKDKNILSIPISLYVSNEDTPISEYGSFAYQGAYVYSINTEKGFILEGRITHLNKENSESDNFLYDENLMINRIIYIGDNLFTVSNSKIKATNFKNFEELGEVSFIDETEETTAESTSAEASSE